MKRTLSIFFLLLMSLPLVCRAEVTDRVVAIVNDDIVTLREVERYVAVEKKAHYTSMYEYLRNMALREKIGLFIENVLIDQQAKKLRMEVNEKEVEIAIEGIKKQNLITDEQLREQLKKEGIEYKDFAAGIKSNLTRHRVLAKAIAQDVPIDDKALYDYYDKHRNDFVQEEYQLQHIFIARREEDASSRAREALKELDAGKPFGDVAKAFSDDPSKDEGGDIGVARKEDLMPELRQAVASLSIGAHTRMIETAYGYHIMKLNGLKKGEAETFEDIKDKIKERLYQQESQKRYKDYVSKLRSAAYVEVKI